MKTQHLTRRHFHFVRGRGRLGTTIVNGLKQLDLHLVDEPKQADVVWFCVPEKALKSEAEKLKSKLNPGARLVHTSGLLGSDTIRVRQDFQVASLHPAYSFSKPLTEMPRDILWTFEGDDGLRNLLQFLVMAWGGKWVEIPPEVKIPYHIACVLMGNLVDIPIGAAEEICRKFRLPFSEMAESLLLPHIAGCKAGSVFENTTGPAARGDSETVKTETEWLRQNFPEQEDVYRLLSGLIQKKNN